MYVDIIFGISIALGFYVGYSQGIIKSLFAIVSLIVAILASMKLSPLMITFLDKQLDWDPRWIIVLGFVLTFIIVVVAIRFAGKMLEKMLVKLEINFMNKILGGSITAFLFLVIFSTFVWFMDEVKLLKEETKKESMTYELVRPIPQVVATLGRQVKPMFQNFWNKTSEAMDQIREDAEGRQELEEKGE